MISKRRTTYKAIDALNFDCYNALGTYLCDMRAIRGLSLRELASLTGVAPQTLRAVEKGGLAPSLIVLSGYTHYTGADEKTIRRILDGKDNTYKCEPLRVYGKMSRDEQNAFDCVQANKYDNVIEALIMEEAKGKK